MSTKELLEDLDFILQERGFEPGTIRSWGDYDYEKQKSGKWKKLKKVASLKRRINDKLPHPPSFEQHMKIGERALAEHRVTLEKKKALLQRLATPGAEIQGRTKELASAVGKVARKPKYGTAANLHDLTGTRVITNTIDEVMDTVDNIKKNLKVIEEDAYIREPKDGYRSYHLVAEDEDGLPFEIQVRTKHQHIWAEWAHGVYKPHNEEEERAKEKHAKALDDYRLKMSAYFYAEDEPSVPKFEKPECPKEVLATPFGCME